MPPRYHHPCLPLSPNCANKLGVEVLIKPLHMPSCPKTIGWFNQNSMTQLHNNIPSQPKILVWHGKLYFLGGCIYKTVSIN